MPHDRSSIDPSSHSTTDGILREKPFNVGSGSNMNSSSGAVTAGIAAKGVDFCFESFSDQDAQVGRWMHL